MERVLIALDYDPTAERIAETGYALAKSMNAEVILMHVLADMMYYMPPEYSPVMGFAGMPPIDMIQPADATELTKAAELFLQASKSHLGDDAIKTVVSEGDFAEAILNTAREKSVSIIVIGSHSRSALEKILMGSVTEKLLHDSDIPLFIVPTKVKASKASEE